jgi:hypothetical protein
VIVATSLCVIASREILAEKRFSPRSAGSVPMRPYATMQTRRRGESVLVGPRITNSRQRGYASGRLEGLLGLAYSPTEPPELAVKAARPWSTPRRDIGFSWNGANARCLPWCARQRRVEAPVDVAPWTDVGDASTTSGSVGLMRLQDSYAALAVRATASPRWHRASCPVARIKRGRSLKRVDTYAARVSSRELRSDLQAVGIQRARTL